MSKLIMLCFVIHGFIFSVFSMEAMTTIQIEGLHKDFHNRDGHDFAKDIMMKLRGANNTLTIVVDNITTGEKDQNITFTRELINLMKDKPNLKLTIVARPKKNQAEPNLIDAIMNDKELIRNNIKLRLTVNYVDLGEFDNFLHDKYFIIDDKEVILTSANLSYNGLGKKRNSESAIIMKGNVDGINITTLFDWNTIIYQNLFVKKRDPNTNTNKIISKISHAKKSLLDFHNNQMKRYQAGDKNICIFFGAVFLLDSMFDGNNGQDVVTRVNEMVNIMANTIQSAKNRIYFSQYNFSYPKLLDSVKKSLSNPAINLSGVIDCKHVKKIDSKFTYLLETKTAKREIIIRKQVQVKENIEQPHNHDKVWVVDDELIFSARNISKTNFKTEMGTTVIAKTPAAEYFAKAITEVVSSMKEVKLAKK